MTMTATVVGIDLTGNQSPDANDNLVAAHIHGSATVNPNADPPTNVGVVWGFFGSPDHDTSPDDLVVTPLPGGIGGTITSKWDLSEGSGGLNGQMPNILAGRTYINFHTAQFGGGEIRGPLVVIPEPSSIALLGVALAGCVAGARWRRRNRVS
jgi:hypothetical protein